MHRAAPAWRQRAMVVLVEHCETAVVDVAKFPSALSVLGFGEWRHHSMHLYVVVDPFPRKNDLEGGIYRRGDRHVRIAPERRQVGVAAASDDVNIGESSIIVDRAGRRASRECWGSAPCPDTANYRGNPASPRVANP
jgi:hypothetical protein